MSHRLRVGEEDIKPEPRARVHESQLSPAPLRPPRQISRSFHAMSVSAILLLFLSHMLSLDFHEATVPTASPCCSQANVRLLLLPRERKR